jgi:hypothetical protein
MEKHLNNVEANLQLDSSLTDMQLALMPPNAAH